MSIFSSIKHLDAYGRLTGSFYQLNLNLIKKASSVYRKKRVPCWVGGNLGGRGGGGGGSWVCAWSSHRRHRAGLGLLGIGIFFAGFSVPKDPGSSVRTSGPKLTVAYNFKWPLVDRQTSTAKFHDFALLCIFFKDLTVVNGWWAYTQFSHLRLMYSVTSLSLAPIFKLPT